MRIIVRSLGRFVITSLYCKVAIMYMKHCDVNKGIRDTKLYYVCIINIAFSNMHATIILQLYCHASDTFNLSHIGVRRYISHLQARYTTYSSMVQILNMLSNFAQMRTCLQLSIL